MCFGICVSELTFSPLALLMALSGLSTLRTLRIFTTLIALDLKQTWDYTAQRSIKLSARLSNGANWKKGWNNERPGWAVLNASVLEILHTKLWRKKTVGTETNTQEFYTSKIWRYKYSFSHLRIKKGNKGTILNYCCEAYKIIKIRFSFR